MSRVVAAVTLLLLGSLSQLGAQVRAVGAGHGTRVRVTAPSVLGAHRLTGKVSHVGADTLFVSRIGDGLFAVPLGALEQLQVAVGKRRGARALKGALIGAVVVPLVSVAITSTQSAPEGANYFVDIIGGVILGTPGGALIGAMTAPQRWQAVSTASLSSPTFGLGP